jgi:hypothetical protein
LDFLQGRKRERDTELPTSTPFEVVRYVDDTKNASNYCAFGWEQSSVPRTLRITKKAAVGKTAALTVLNAH